MQNSVTKWSTKTFVNKLFKWTQRNESESVWVFLRRKDAFLLWFFPCKFSQSKNKFLLKTTAWTAKKLRSWRASNTVLACAAIWKSQHQICLSFMHKSLANCLSCLFPKDQALMTMLQLPSVLLTNKCSSEVVFSNWGLAHWWHKWWIHFYWRWAFAVIAVQLKHHAAMSAWSPLQKCVWFIADHFAFCHMPKRLNINSQVRQFAMLLLKCVMIFFPFGSTMGQTVVAWATLGFWIGSSQCIHDQMSQCTNWLKLS